MIYPQYRREKNRLAQQAYQARQKVKIKALESEWEQLQQLYEALYQAWLQRTKEIEQLHLNIELLLQNIKILRQSQEDNRYHPSLPLSSVYPLYRLSYHEQQRRQTELETLSDFNLWDFFSKGGFSEFPEFLSENDSLQVTLR
jgi:hypothetical protein